MSNNPLRIPSIIVNAVAYGETLWSFTIRKDYSFGVIWGIVSIVLSILSLLLHLYTIRKDFVYSFEMRNGAIYTAILTVGYVLLTLVVYPRIMTTDSTIYGLLPMAAIPFFYSVLMLTVFFISPQNANTFVKVSSWVVGAMGAAFFFLCEASLFKTNHGPTIIQHILLIIFGAPIVTAAIFAPAALVFAFFNNK